MAVQHLKKYIEPYSYIKNCNTTTVYTFINSKNPVPKCSTEKSW